MRNLAIAVGGLLLLGSWVFDAWQWRTRGSTCLVLAAWMLLGLAVWANGGQG